MVITAGETETVHHGDRSDDAQQLFERMHAVGYSSVAFGDIAGEGYTVVYYRTEDQTSMDFIEDWSKIGQRITN